MFAADFQDGTFNVNKRLCNASIVQGGKSRVFAYRSTQAGQHSFKVGYKPASLGQNLYLSILSNCSEAAPQCLGASLLGDVDVDLEDGQVVYLIVTDGARKLDGFEISVNVAAP